MNVQGRVCTNCMKFNSGTSKCAIGSTATTIAQPNSFWCWEGQWAWWDKNNNRWQLCRRHDDSIDMSDRTKPPMHRDIITTMITNVPSGYKVTFDGRIIPTEEEEY